MAGDPMFAPIGGGRRGSRSPADDGWIPIIPVPADAPAPPAGHRDLGRASAIFEYRSRAGELLGQIRRFEDATAGKKFRPLTFCRHAETADRAWRWRGFEAPRPLYGLDRLAARPDAPVIVTEGEKATDAAGRLLPDHVAVTSPNGSRSAGKADWTALAGRQVIIWPDNDEPGAAYAAAVVKALRQAGAASIAVIDPPSGVKDGWDAADAEAEGWSGTKASGLAQRAKPAEEPSASPEAGGWHGPPARDALMELVEGIELWHTIDREAYATIPVKDHLEHWPVKESMFREWLAVEYFKRHGRGPGETAINDALGTIAAMAWLGAEHPVFVRVARIEDAIYVDLADEGWRVIRVDRNGWNVRSDPAIKFKRVDAMRPLPEPEPEGSIDELRPFVNVANEGQFKMVVAWLVAALNSDEDFECPILLVHGEQGSSKSTLTRVLRSLVDPNLAPIRAAPGKVDDLVLYAENSRILAFDNLSVMPAWLSDLLCQVSSGGGFSTRKLYQGRKEEVFQFQRAVILNGIPELAKRPDLVSRCIPLTLPAIADEERRTSAEFWRSFRARRPSILGALLDAVSAALRRMPEIRVPAPPRMAGFATWATAAEPGLGWSDGEFGEAYAVNRTAAVEAAIEADPLALALQEVIAEDDFEGTATELLAHLDNHVSERVKSGQGWPAVNKLRDHLTRLQPAMRSLGIIIDLDTPRTSDRHRHRIIKVSIPSRGAP